VGAEPPTQLLPTSYQGLEFVVLLQSIVCDCTLPSGKHNEPKKSSPNEIEKQGSGRCRPPLNFGKVHIEGVVEFGWGGKWIQLTKNKKDISQQS